MLVAIGINGITEAFSGTVNHVVKGGVVCLVMLQCWKTMSQNNTWTSRESLFRFIYMFILIYDVILLIILFRN